MIHPSFIINSLIGFKNKTMRKGCSSVYPHDSKQPRTRIILTGLKLIPPYYFVTFIFLETCRSCVWRKWKYCSPLSCKETAQHRMRSFILYVRIIRNFQTINTKTQQKMKRPKVSVLYLTSISKSL